MSNDKLRKLFPQGPNYRENKTISFKKRKKSMSDGLQSSNHRLFLLNVI